MLRYNPTDFYDLGATLAPLRFLPETLPLSGEVRTEAVLASVALSKLISHPYLGLSEATAASAARLTGLLDLLARGRLRRSLAQAEDGAELGSLAEFISEEAKRFETLLGGDCEALNLFSLPRVLAYETKILLSDGLALLPPSARSKIVMRLSAAADVRQGARCLALNLWTPAGFHVTRATEAILREYWLHVRKAAALPEKHTWGQLCYDLLHGTPATKKNPTPTLPARNKRLHAMMFALGVEFRNPFIHPEDSLDEEDGPLLVNSCIAAITKMLSKLPEASP